MNKNILIVVGITILFLGTCINPSVAIDNVKESFLLLSNGNTLYVGGSGEGNYSKIQDAIDNASEGDTVFVYDDSSPYYEHLIVNKSISLIGEDKETTVIDGNKTGDVVYIWYYANWVNISGFTIQNSGDNNSDSGINNRGCYSLIKDNIISQNQNGYRQYGGYKNIIRDNKFIDNIYRGIWVVFDEVSDFERNYINGSVYGIALYDCKQSSIINNIILSCSEAGIFYTWSSHFNEGYEISGNEINSNKYGILAYGGSALLISSNLISNNYEFGIFLGGSLFTKVIKNNFIDNKRSASFKNSKFIRWSGNYWDRPRLLPKLILGKLGIFLLIPWVQFDWHPAKEPYDI